MYKKKVLIIDDEKDFCKTVKMNLELKGKFNVDFAYNGKQGIELARKTLPDLILLDLCMPVMDGFAVLKMLKEDEKTQSIPVVMLSALADQASKIKASGLYDEDYITKPIEAPELIAKIEEVFKRIKF